MSWRPGPDGTLVAPHRGKPPACPDGYEPMPGNPFVVRLILAPCKHRKWTKFDRPCCGGRTGYTACELLQKPVLRKHCSECDLHEPPDR